jgi:hypothetical protein
MTPVFRAARGTILRESLHAQGAYELLRGFLTEDATELLNFYVKANLPFATFWTSAQHYTVTKESSTTIDEQLDKLKRTKPVGPLVKILNQFQALHMKKHDTLPNKEAAQLALPNAQEDLKIFLSRFFPHMAPEIFAATARRKLHYEQAMKLYEDGMGSYPHETILYSPCADMVNVALSRLHNNPEPLPVAVSQVPKQVHEIEQAPVAKAISSASESTSSIKVNLQPTNIDDTIFTKIPIEEMTEATISEITDPEGKQICELYQNRQGAQLRQNFPPGNRPMQIQQRPQIQFGNQDRAQNKNQLQYQPQGQAQNQANQNQHQAQQQANQAQGQAHFQHQDNHLNVTKRLNECQHDVEKIKLMLEKRLGNDNLADNVNKVIIPKPQYQSTKFDGIPELPSDRRPRGQEIEMIPKERIGHTFCQLCGRFGHTEDSCWTWEDKTKAELQCCNCGGYHAAKCKPMVNKNPDTPRQNL